jgi:hypothetical protein
VHVITDPDTQKVKKKKKIASVSDVPDTTQFSHTVRGEAISIYEQIHVPFMHSLNQDIELRQDRTILLKFRKLDAPNREKNRDE